MAEPGEKVFGVAEFLDLLNKLLLPQRAVVQGEIGEINHLNRYSFFKLRDEDKEAILDCFVWRETLDGLDFRLKEGLEIKVAGYPEIYKPKGRFSFRVEKIGLVGEGALKLAFEALKKKLSAKGFFVAGRKRKPPSYVEKIGLITSASGDAKNDFLTHLGNYGFKINFFDVRVEGLYAVDEIVSAIRWFNRNLDDVEVLVLTRGGGSLESLSAFNSEAVAEAIFSSRIPVITGIGHENDETIADLTADVYTSTPTAAARVLSDPWRRAEVSLSACGSNILSLFARHCDSIKLQFNLWEKDFALAVQNSLAAEKSDLANRVKMFWPETERWLKRLGTVLSNYEQKLSLSDPNLRLRQGYSIVFNAAHKLIKSAKQIRVGERLNLRFYEGGATSRVEKVDDQI